MKKTVAAIEFGSKKFMSLRYNLPMWIINLWEKNCGDFLAKKQFRALSSKNLNSALRINSHRINDEEFFKDLTYYIGPIQCLLKANEMYNQILDLLTELSNKNEKSWNDYKVEKI